MDYLPFSALRQTLGNEPPYCLNKVIPQCHGLPAFSEKPGNLRYNSVFFRKFRDLAMSMTQTTRKKLIFMLGSFPFALEEKCKTSVPNNVDVNLKL